MSEEAARAFAAYLSVRHRLPEAAFPDRPQRAGTLGDIADEFDAILLDAYGVLNVGERPIDGAAARIAALRAAGKRVMVVSNSAGYPKRQMMARYSRLGFDFAPDEVVTSREALLHHMAGEAPRRWGLVLNDAHGLSEFEHLDAAFLGDDPAGYDAAQGVLMVGSDGWTEARQGLLVEALAARPRPVIVGNPDIVAPRENGLSLEPGHFAHGLADATGISPVFLGKPFRGIFDLACARMTPAPRRVLMVGDTLHTDILGGAHMGFATALVTDHGSLVGLDVDDAIARSGIVPDFVIDRI